MSQAKTHTRQSPMKQINFKLKIFSKKQKSAWSSASVCLIAINRRKFFNFYFVFTICTSNMFFLFVGKKTRGKFVHWWMFKLSIIFFFALNFLKVFIHTSQANKYLFNFWYFVWFGSIKIMWMRITAFNLNPCFA